MRKLNVLELSSVSGGGVVAGVAKGVGKVVSEFLPKKEGSTRTAVSAHAIDKNQGVIVGNIRGDVGQLTGHIA